jgi:hypothetical protein
VALVLEIRDIWPHNVRLNVVHPLILGLTMHTCA